MGPILDFFGSLGRYFHAAYEFAISLAGSFEVLPLLSFFCFVDGVAPLLPSETLMIGLGSLWGQGKAVHGGLVILFGALGAFAGDVLAYHLGRLIPLAKMPGFRGEKGEKKIRHTQRALIKRGTMYILAARFVPLGRVAVNMTAGAIRYPRNRFIPTSLIACFIWSGYSVFLGMLAGKLVHDSPIIAIAVGIASGILFGKLLDIIMGKIAKWWYGEKYDLAMQAQQQRVLQELGADPEAHAQDEAEAQGAANNKAEVEDSSETDLVEETEGADEPKGKNETD